MSELLQNVAQHRSKNEEVVAYIRALKLSSEYRIQNTLFHMCFMSDAGCRK
jgi:hypothetical protein